MNAAGGGGDLRPARRAAAGDRARGARACGLLTPPALLRRLDQRLALLTGGAQDVDARQRTLRGTIAWSHDLLLAKEQTLFARLAVFVGGCRLEAAEAVCDSTARFGDELLDGLDSLVEKSLLRQRQDSDGEPRFWMLETIRELASSCSSSSGELEAACERHAAWTADAVEQLDAESRTGDHPAFLARVDDEYANVREAIAFARKAGDGELLLRLATALWGFWSSRVYGSEGRRALEEALELSGRRPARTLLGLCTLRMLSGSSENLREAAQEALEACEQLGDDYSLAQAWNLVGRVEGTVMGSMATGEDAWRQALAFARRGKLPGGDRREHLLADGELGLRAAAGRGGHRPLPGVPRARRGRPDDPRDLLRRAGGARGDAGRPRDGPCAARRGHEDDRGVRAHPLGRAERAGDLPRPATRRHAGRGGQTLRRSFATLDEGGERAYLSSIAGFLAHALAAEGEDEAAERFSRESEQAASPDDVLSQVVLADGAGEDPGPAGRARPGRALAREAGRLRRADRSARHPRDALVDLAEVLARAGRREESLAALARGLGAVPAEGRTSPRSLAPERGSPFDTVRRRGHIRPMPSSPRTTSRSTSRRTASTPQSSRTGRSRL